MLSAQDVVRADLAGYAMASNLEFNNQIKQRIAAGEQIYHLGFGQSPFPIPETLRKALQNHAHIHEYLPAQGLKTLREKVIEHHRVHYGHQHFSVDQMLFGCGTKELIYLVMTVFSGDGIVQSPCWTTYLPQMRLAGKKCAIVPSTFENKYKVQPDDAEKVFQGLPSDQYKMMIINSPNNPTGQIYTHDELTALVKVFRAYKVLVISDEIYAGLTYAGNTFTSIANIYPEGTIVTNGFSKWASVGGWRTGYALFPNELLHLYKAVASAASHTYTCGPAPMQYAISDSLDDAVGLNGYVKFTSMVLNAVAQYTTKLVHCKLRSVGVRVHDAQSGYYVMPDFECLKHRFSNGQQMCDAIMNDLNIALMPCDPHFVSPNGELTVRLCYINFNGLPIMVNRVAQVDEAYLNKYCGNTLKAVDLLADWVVQQKSLDPCFDNANASLCMYTANGALSYRMYNQYRTSAL